MDSRNGHHHHHHHRAPPPLPISHNHQHLTNAMQEHQRELARLERIRLDAPRPDAERFTNDYVDAPKLPLRKQPTTQTAPVSSKKHLDTDHFLTKQPTSADILPLKPQLSAKKPCAIHGHPEVKKKQPTEEKRTTLDDFTVPGEPGIICPECGQCRCSACLAPKKLPSYWLCNGNFECSAENLVDQVSCLCCVKGILYHFPADDRESTAADHPCACDGGGCCQRWTLMGLLSVTCLPCLLCYWPCKTVAKVAAKGYAAYHRRGCRCPAPSTSSSLESSPVASIRPLTRRSTPPIPPTRPGHARRISAGTTTGKAGVFL